MLYNSPAGGSGFMRGFPAVGGVVRGGPPQPVFGRMPVSPAPDQLQLPLGKLGAGGAPKVGAPGVPQAPGNMQLELLQQQLAAMEAARAGGAQPAVPDQAAEAQAASMKDALANLTGNTASPFHSNMDALQRRFEEQNSRRPVPGHEGAPIWQDAGGNVRWDAMGQHQFVPGIGYIGNKQHSAPNLGLSADSPYLQPGSNRGPGAYRDAVLAARSNRPPMPAAARPQGRPAMGINDFNSLRQRLLQGLQSRFAG